MRISFLKNKNFAKKKNHLRKVILLKTITIIFKRFFFIFFNFIIGKEAVPLRYGILYLFLQETNTDPKSNLDELNIKFI